jgi:hypothetical protein
MSTDDALFEPRLTQQELAEAAGLDVHVVRRHCQTFAADLDSEGSGPDQRWAPACVQTLQLIHQLYQYGQDTESIRELFNVAPEEGRPPRPSADAPTPRAPATNPPEPSTPQEITWTHWSQFRPQGTWRGVQRLPAAARWPWRRGTIEA